MRLVTITDLISVGRFPASPQFEHIAGDIRAAIEAVRWPPQGPDFTIYPESGKKRGEGNGVVPIKRGFVETLRGRGWLPEGEFPRDDTQADEDPDILTQPGAFDVRLDLSPHGLLPFVAEWETGNVSSSHRALNKMALALVFGRISGGILVVPVKRLAQYLTDRIGNYEELRPYFPLYSALRIENGYLGIAAVEHDAESYAVPRIPKGTSGRAVS